MVRQARRFRGASVPTKHSAQRRWRRVQSVERLEERQLLASDVLTGLDVAALAAKDSGDFIANPFRAGDVTLDQMVARARSHAYVPGELIVATSSPLSSLGSTRETWSWEQLLGVSRIESSLSLADFSDAQTRAEVELYHLNLGTGGDVVAAMRALDKADGILWSSPNFSYEGSDPREFTPNDPQYASQYHHPLMQNNLAWDTTLGSPSVIIGISDDGVSTTHVDLSPNIWNNPGEIPGDSIDNDGNGYVDDVNGWDFISNDNNPNHNGGDNHGSHVAGIAAARTNNATGVSGTAGQSTIMPLKFYDGANPGAWTSTVIFNSYKYAIDNGAKIVSTSYNVDGYVGDPTFVSAVSYIVNNGGLHFNSAGNNSQLNPPRQAFQQSLMVVSTTNTDAKSDFSNYGTGVDISAPGSSILSTVPTNSYDVFSGTSMATPNAAGAAALIWSAHPGYSNYQVAAQLLGTADNIDGVNPAYAGLLGAGRVNSFKAVGNSLSSAPKVESLVGIPGGTVTVGANLSSFGVSYDQVMDPTSVTNSASYELREAGSDGQFGTGDDELYPLSVPNPYYPGTNDLQVNIGGGPLGIGSYRLRILPGGVENAFGTDLDGDANGVAGGTFERFFSVTLNTFQRVAPLGSLVSASLGNPSSLQDSSDTDDFPFFAESGERISAFVTPQSPTATLSVQLVGISGIYSATAPGQPVMLPASAIASSGIKSLRVSGNDASAYSVDIYRNANLGGLDESQATVNISDSFLTLGSGRYAAIGSASGSTGGVNLNRYSNPSLFVDISATGTALGLSDDGNVNITTSVGNALFPSGTVTVGNNGGIIATPGESVPVTNGAIPSSDFQNALLPFWDDIDSDTGNVYWQERLVNGINTLIVQWNNRPHYSNVGSVTFQLQLFQSGPVAARFVYPDVDFGNAQYNFGASATIGLQTSSSVGYQFSQNTASLANGDVIDVTFGVPTTDVDSYLVDLTGQVGKSIDVVVTGLNGSSMTGQTVELLDGSNTVVATASASAANYQLGILDYVVATGGTHTVRVSTNITAQYAVQVSQDLVFDTEPNNTIGSSLRSLDNVGGAHGFIAGATVSILDYNDPSLFVDISGTGTSLALGDDDTATITSTVGNSLFPAGSVTIGNNGGIIAGAGEALSFANGALPNTAWDTALLPFWDDMDDETGSIYWEERLVGGIQTLIVQWHDRPHYDTPSSVGMVTFQVQVFASGPVAARFAYLDTVFGDPEFDNGASATIGYQISTTNAGTLSQNQATVFDGDVVDFVAVETDLYELTLGAGESVTLRTATPFDDPSNTPGNALDPRLQVLDSAGTELAADSNSLDGKNAEIVFTSVSGGTFYVGVGRDGGDGEYVLSVDSGTGIDGDFDDDGDYDCDDVNQLSNAIVFGGSVSQYDLSGDNILSLADITAWLSEAGEENLGSGRSYLQGDANLSAAVDGSDFGIWNANKFTSNANWCQGDFNASGAVDGSDFGLWNANKFTSSDAGGRSNAVGVAIPTATASGPGSVTKQSIAAAELEMAPVGRDRETAPAAAVPIPTGRASAVDRLFAETTRERTARRDRSRLFATIPEVDGPN